MFKFVKRVPACVSEATQDLGSYPETVTSGLTMRSSKHNWP